MPELLVFVVGSVAISCLCHTLIPRWWIASPIAAIWTSIAYQCFVFFQIGHWDPLALVGLIVGGIYGIIIAALVGIPFAIRRR